MKNYLIKHAARKIEKFLKLAQVNTNPFAEAFTKINQLLAGLQGSEDAKIIGKFYNRDAVKEVIDSIRSISTTNQKNSAFIDMANTLYLIIDELIAETTDAIDNPDFDGDLSEAGNTDFYENFEEILLDLQDQLTSDYGVDPDSDSYKEADRGIFLEDLKKENFVDPSTIHDPNITKLDGAATKGFAKAVEEQIDAYKLKLKDFDKTPQMIEMGHEIIKILQFEKKPMSEAVDNLRVDMANSGISHFLRVDNLDPKQFEKKYHPDGRPMKRDKAYTLKVNPAWKAATGDIMSRVEKINSRVQYLFEQVKLMYAKYNAEKGIVPDIEKVVPEHQELYKKLVSYQNILLKKSRTLTHFGKSGSVTESLDYLIKKCLDSKNNAFDVNLPANKSQIDNVEDYFSDLKSKQHDWASKSKYILNLESGKMMLANLAKIQQNSNTATSALNSTFFQDILFNTFLQTQSGDFSHLSEFSKSLEAVYEIKKEVSLISEIAIAYKNKLREKIKMSSNELDAGKNSVAKLKIVSKKLAEAVKNHTALTKSLGKSITKLVNDLGGGQEHFDEPRLNELSDFLKKIYEIRKDVIILSKLISKIENGESLKSNELVDCLDLYSKIDNDISDLMDFDILSWGEQVTGNVGPLKTALNNMKQSCKESMALFSQKVQGE